MTAKRIRLFLVALFLIYGIGGLLPAAAVAPPTGGATAVEPSSPLGFGPIQGVVDLLKAGGPLAAAVLMGWFALRKDREKSQVIEASNAQFRTIHDQMVGIIQTQTAAMVKLEVTVSALKDVIVDLQRRLEV